MPLGIYCIIFGDDSQSLTEEPMSNLIDNEEKILHHGKRADSIVKAMLQHTRTTAGGR
jgi:two-component system, NtrC family, sensor kinase